MVIEKGKECGWNTETRRIFHYACKEHEESQPDAEQYALADRLGYRHVSWSDLQPLSREGSDEPERRDSDSRGSDAIRTVPASDQGAE